MALFPIVLSSPSQTWGTVRLLDPAVEIGQGIPSDAMFDRNDKTVEPLYLDCMGPCIEDNRLMVAVLVNKWYE